MKKVILAILAAVVFGKMLPIILLGGILIGLAVMVKAAAEEANK